MVYGTRNWRKAAGLDPNASSIERFFEQRVSAFVEYGLPENVARIKARQGVTLRGKSWAASKRTLRRLWRDYQNEYERRGTPITLEEAKEMVRQDLEVEAEIKPEDFERGPYGGMDIAEFL